MAAEQPEHPSLVTELQQQLAAAKEEVLSLRLSLKELGAANANAATPSAARAALAPSPAKLTLPEDDDSAGASGKWNLPKWSRGAGVPSRCAPPPPPAPPPSTFDLTSSELRCAGRRLGQAARRSVPF